MTDNPTPEAKPPETKTFLDVDFHLVSGAVHPFSLDLAAGDKLIQHTDGWEVKQVNGGGWTAIFLRQHVEGIFKRERVVTLTPAHYIPEDLRDKDGQPRKVKKTSGGMTVN